MIAKFAEKSNLIPTGYNPIGAYSKHSDRPKCLQYKSQRTWSSIAATKKRFTAEIAETAEKRQKRGKSSKGQRKDIRP